MPDYSIFDDIRNIDRAKQTRAIKYRQSNDQYSALGDNYDPQSGTYSLVDSTGRTITYNGSKLTDSQVNSGDRVYAQKQGEQHYFDAPQTNEYNPYAYQTSPTGIEHAGTSFLGDGATHNGYVNNQIWTFETKTKKTANIKYVYSIDNGNIRYLYLGGFSSQDIVLFNFDITKFTLRKLILDNLGGKKYRIDFELFDLENYPNIIVNTLIKTNLNGITLNISNGYDDSYVSTLYGYGLVQFYSSANILYDKPYIYLVDGQIKYPLTSSDEISEIVITNNIPLSNIISYNSLSIGGIVSSDDQYANIINLYRTNGLKSIAIQDIYTGLIGHTYSLCWIDTNINLVTNVTSLNARDFFDNYNFPYNGSITSSDFLDVQINGFTRILANSIDTTFITKKKQQIEINFYNSNFMQMKTNKIINLQPPQYIDTTFIFYTLSYHG